MIGINLGNVSPDPRTFLIGEPKRPITRCIHHIDEVMVFIPRFIRFVVAKGKQFAEDGNRRGMRTDNILKDTNFPFGRHFVKMRCIRQIISIKMHVIAVRRFS